MPVNTTPIFLGTPKIGQVLLDFANTARDGSGSLATLFTAGTYGSRIDFITFVSNSPTVGATSAKVCRVFLTDNTGANPRLLQEIVMPAVTSSNTAIGATQTITFTNGLIIMPGQIVKATISVRSSSADDTAAFARGGDY